jgi:hypothetical protein
MTIVRLNGTHGSGKSTVAYRLLRKFPHKVVQTPGAKKPSGYVVTLPVARTLGIVGPYTTACGGCDAVQPFADIWPRVLEFYQSCDHVFFEGALLSTTYGAQGKASEALGADFIFAFMDTPLATCVERVDARRAAAGKGPLANSVNIESKWHTINRLHTKLNVGLVGAGQRTAIIRHQTPTKDVLALLGVRINKEPV